MIDFELPAELTAMRDRVNTFIADKIVPYENDIRQTAHGASEPLRQELVALARLNTIAQQDGNDFLISGSKYMITGVDGAAFNIVMARTLDPVGKDLGAT